MTACDYFQLKSFLSGYFHEDWEMDASRPDEVVSQFLKSKPDLSEIELIIDQINRYLKSAVDDLEVERGLFEKLGCYYLPSADGVSAADWLRRVALLLDER